MPERKTVDAVADFLMFELVGMANNSIYALTTYMQETTPYGEEYRLAFEKLKEVSEKMKEAEEALQGCVELKKR